MLSYVDEGSGPVVVLLHGWPVTPLHWRHVQPSLVEAGRRVLMVTLPGLGDADDHVPDGQLSGGAMAWDKSALAARVGGLLDDLDIGGFTVVGHDWGGTVGYLLAARESQTQDARVRLLVIEEEVPPGVAVEVPQPGRSSYPDWHGPFLRAPGLAEALLPGREDVFHRAFLTASAGPPGLDSIVVESYVGAYRGRHALAATVGYYRAADQDAGAVRQAAVRSLDVPVLTVGGRHALGTAVRDAFTQLATHVEHLQADHAGHYPAEQAPDVVLSRLLDLV